MTEPLKPQTGTGDFQAEKAEHYIRLALSVIPKESNNYYEVIRKHCVNALRQLNDNMVRRYVVDALRVAELGVKKGMVNNKDLIYSLNNALKSCDKVSSEGRLTSPQRRMLSEKVLSTKERKGAKKALPGKDAYPIPDKEHAKNALARAKQFASPADQATITRNVKKEYPGIDVEMKPSEPTVKLGPTSKKKAK
jgi:hypothetical protein